MKKIIIFIIMTMVLIPNINVNAEEVDSCYNNYLIDVSSDSWSIGVGNYDVSSDSWLTTNSTSNFAYLKYLFSIQPNKTYYLKFFNLGSVFSFGTPHKVYDSDFNYSSIYSNIDTSYDPSNYQFTITVGNIDNSIKYIHFSFYIFGRAYDTLKSSPIAFADFDLSSCPIIEEPEPEVPPVEEPDIPEIIPDTTLTDFYLLYLNKLTSLSQYALENKFLLSAIGIILAFVVLELVLFLFNRGGYKR